MSMKTLSEFLNRIIENNKGSEEARKILEPYKAKTTGFLEEGQGSLGGFTTPDKLFDEVLDVVLENSIIRPRATVVRMTSDTMSVSRIVDTSHLSSVLGGIVVSWVNELASISESNPAFGRLALRAKGLKGLCHTSAEWLADSGPAPEALLRQAFGQALAFESDDQYMRGDGINRPLGILNSGAVIEVARAGTALAWGDLVNMNQRLLPRFEGGLPNAAIWLMNSDTQSKVYGTSPGSGFVDNGQILRKDYFFSEHQPHWGVTGDIVLVAPQAYLIADRDLIVDVSDSNRFESDDVSFKFTLRGDGVPIPVSPITPKYGTQTQSPFVVLAGGVSSSSSSSLSVSSSSSSLSSSSSSG